MDYKIVIYLVIAVAYYWFKYYKNSRKILPPNDGSKNKKIEIKYPEEKQNTEILINELKKNNEIENKATYEVASTKNQVENIFIKKEEITRKEKSPLQNSTKLNNLSELKRAFIYSEILKTKF
jgi:hypothetical protein